MRDNTLKRYRKAKQKYVRRQKKKRMKERNLVVEQRKNWAFTAPELNYAWNVFSALEYKNERDRDCNVCGKRAERFSRGNFVSFHFGTHIKRLMSFERERNGPGGDNSEEMV